MGTAGDRKPDGFKLLLCHRRRGIVPAAEFHRTWRDKGRELVLGHQSTLGYRRYAQVHQVAWANPLYEGIVASRSRPVTNLVSRLMGRTPDREEEGSRKWRRERWDVIDEFWFDDRERMLNAWQSEEGKRAANELVALRTGLVERTSVMLGAEYVISSSGPSYPAARVMFCLRHRPEQSREEMFAYWLVSHGKLAASLAGKLGYDQYDQVHSDWSDRASSVAESLGASHLRRYDGMASLTYPDEASLLKRFLGLEAEEANLRLIEDEFNFVDGQKLGVVLGEQSVLYRD